VTYGCARGRIQKIVKTVSAPCEKRAGCREISTEFSSDFREKGLPVEIMLRGLFRCSPHHHQIVRAAMIKNIQCRVSDIIDLISFFDPRFPSKDAASNSATAFYALKRRRRRC
jgi:hypothetical protein